MAHSLFKTYDMKQLLDDNNSEINKDLDNSLRSFGFVAVSNHNISVSLMDNLYEKLQLFFNLDEKIKNKYLFSDELMVECGYSPIGIGNVSSTLGIKTPHDLCEDLSFVYRKDGNNIIYPKEIDGLDKVIKEYKSNIEDLSKVLLLVFASVLDVDKGKLLSLFNPPKLKLRFVNYPGHGGLTILPGQLRFGAHQDYGMLTILKPDNNVSGLQIQDSLGVWHDIACHNDELIINCGDLLSYWTGNRWRSALHRVVNHDIKSNRLSMVAFFDPDKDSMIAPVFPMDSGVISEPVNAGEYINKKLAVSILK